MLKNIIRAFAISTLIASPALSQVKDITPGYYAPGYSAATNYVINPSCFANAKAADFTVSGSGSIARTTTAPLENGASCALSSTASGDKIKFKTRVLDNALKNGNCEISAYYTGDGSKWIAYAENGSTKVSADITLQDVGTSGRMISAIYPCGDLSSTTQLVFESTAVSAATIKVGNAYVGKAASLGSAAPVNTFTAKVSAAGTVTDETGGDWISSCSYSAGAFTCTFTSGFFTQAPNCSAQTATTSKWGGTSIGSVSSASVLYAVWNNSGVGINEPATLYCTRAGSSFIQPAITPDSWDYPPTAYTPTFTGFGTPTSVECTHARIGAYMALECSFTSGTSTATEARISLPNNLTTAVLTTRSIKVLGSWWRGVPGTTGAKGGTVLAESNLGYLTFSARGVIGSGAENPHTKANGNNLTDSGDTMSFSVLVPIRGWSVSNRAPQLVGSVTSNASNALRTESITFAGASYTTACSSTPCTLYGPNTSWATVTRSGVGLYSINFNQPFSSYPDCTITLTVLSGQAFALKDLPTTSSMAFNIYSVAGALANGGGTITCTGPR